ncbi:neuropeptide FF receptor 2-like [Actinia tenebrosa]|uniref:Neuropeptide FF receptor 2-like n=1 Tax=Actinia tenebrosa TaxID=6105 RepID=A0A6P8HN79_ACTTE|nr:neuropeptide FF receptor 2-like [Actinia tenebrosa]XP_031554121.1 neuropeptide FF receptor 2-like [Actinia tenebrosa]
MASAGDIALKFVFFVIALIGIAGNILVCLVVLLNKSMRTPMNYLLVNLAISDMMFLMFLSPQFAFEGIFDDHTKASGDLFCKFMTVLAWTSGYTSAFILIAIAFERYLAITRPHDLHMRITLRSLRFIVIFCLFLGLSWNAIGFFIKVYDVQQEECTGVWPQVYSKQVYKTLSFLVVCCIPVVIMFLLYSKVVYALWFKAQHSVSGFSQLSVIKSRKKVTKILLTVSILYTLCWVPQSFLYMIRSYVRSLRDTPAYPVSVALLTVNSAANPFIYCLHSSRFRMHLKNLIRFDSRELCMCLRMRRRRTQPITIDHEPQPSLSRGETEI